MKKFYKIKDSSDFEFLCFGLPINVDDIAMNLKGYEWHGCYAKRGLILKYEQMIKVNILFVQLLEGDYENI